MMSVIAAIAIILALLLGLAVEAMEGYSATRPGGGSVPSPDHSLSDTGHSPDISK
jgi:hypothetical protein